MSSLWSLSTDEGSTLSADELVGVLSVHHQRVLGGWRDLTVAQWAQPSRNVDWSVHDTARHVADAMESCTAGACGEPSPFGIADFDPRSTPDRWLALSADDPPDRTIERFGDAAERLRQRVGDRMAADDASTANTVYGPAHWTIGIVHVFWDSWLHERDVLLPLGWPADSSIAERRLVGLYGLLVAMVPAMMMDRTVEAAVQFTGPPSTPVAVGHHAGRVRSAETSTAETTLRGELTSVVDSLAGRGEPIADVLPGAPAEFGQLAEFFAS